MEINLALKESGQVTLKDIMDVRYASLYNGVLYWFSIIEGKLEPVRLDWINDKDWIPYNPIKEIRPSMAGELWGHIDGGTFYIHRAKDESDALEVTRYYGRRETMESVEEIIHGEKGWTLKYSPDKEVMKGIKEIGDANTERTVIEDVGFFETETDYCVSFTYAEDRNKYRSLINKSNMKMTLEYSKQNKQENNE